MSNPTPEEHKRQLEGIKHRAKHTARWCDFKERTRQALQERVYFP